MAKKRYTIDGISAAIDERIFSDYRLLELQVQVSEPEPSKDDPDYAKKVAARGAATVKFINMVLSDEKEKVMDAIAKKNDGFCNVEDVSNWIAKLLTKTQEAKK